MTLKKEYVGNHGGAYLDDKGMSRQFTYIDHDKKPIISTYSNEKIDYSAFFKRYRADLMYRITSLPASICHEWFHEFTIRGEGLKTIEWNTDMLLDNGVSILKLRDICVTLENKAELMRLTK